MFVVPSVLWVLSGMLEIRFLFLVFGVCLCVSGKRLAYKSAISNWINTINYPRSNFAIATFPLIDDATRKRRFVHSQHNTIHINMHENVKHNRNTVCALSLSFPVAVFLSLSISLAHPALIYIIQFIQIGYSTQIISHLPERNGKYMYRTSERIANIICYLKAFLSFLCLLKMLICNRYLKKSYFNRNIGKLCIEHDFILLFILFSHFFLSSAVASYVSFVFCVHNCEVKRDANEVAVGSYLRIRAKLSLNKEDSRAHALSLSLSNSGDINKIQSKKMMKVFQISYSKLMVSFA